jgi:catalase
MDAIMASTVSSGLQKAINLNDSTTNNPKLADIAKDTYNTEDTNTRITTDFGQKVGDTDHWLSVSTEDRYGPALLEDTHGREKVCSIPNLSCLRRLRIP